MCSGSFSNAALGVAGKPGLYEPIHGSAPDIAGQGLANPLAAILSFEMALRWSLDRTDLADKLYAAVNKALENGARPTGHARPRMALDPGLRPHSGHPTCACK